MVQAVNMGCCILPNANIESTENPREVRAGEILSDLRML